MPTPATRPTQRGAARPQGQVIPIRDDPEIRASISRDLAITREILTRHAPMNLGAFASRYLPHMVFSDPGQVHLDLYRDLQGLLWEKPLADSVSGPKVRKAAAYALPRGHGKSTTMVAALLWTVCCWRDMPHFKGRAPHILVVSDTLEQAENRIADLLDELEKNSELIARFGPFAPAPGERRKWKGTHLELPDGTVIRALGTKSKVRGLIRSGRRPSLILVDDVENDEAVATKAQRNKLAHFFLRSLIPTGKAGELLTIVIGTILHAESLLSRLLHPEHHQAFLKRRYAARFDSDGTPSVDGRHVLWPEYWTSEALDIRRGEIGSVAFAQEYLNLPIDDGASPFRLEWLRAAQRRGAGRGFCYTPPPRVRLDTVLSTWDPLELAALVDDAGAYQFVVTAWDLGIVEDEKAARERDNDFTVGMTIGLTIDDRIDVLRVYRRRGMSPGELRSRIVSEQSIVGADVVVVEGNAAQRIIELDLRGVPGLPIVRHITDSRKRSVYEGVPSMALSLELERLDFRWKNEAEKSRIDTLIDELHGLGVEGHDDMVMALWMAMATVRRWILRRDARRRKAIGAPPPGTYADLFPLRPEEREAALAA